VSLALAVLTDLSPSERKYLVASLVKLIERDPHLGPVIAALPQRILLKLFEPFLSM